MGARDAIVVAVMLVGCGGGGTSSVALEDYAAEYNKASCEFQVECGLAADADACFPIQLTASLWFQTALNDVATGIVTYDAEAAADCVETWGNSCNAFGDELQSPCDNVFTGTIAAGGTCFASFECADHGTCVPDDPSCDDTTTCCAGTCAAPIATGQPCIDSADAARCAVGNYCKPADPSSGQGTCAALITTAGTACESFAACAPPLYCDGVCKVAAASGEPCHELDLYDCNDFRDYCEPASSTCVRRLADGEACVEDSGVECSVASACYNGTCTAGGGVGDACADAGPFCATGLECANSVCIAQSQPDAMSCR